MKAVPDTNVLVSGLLPPYGPPGKIVKLAADGLLELCYDSIILAEYRDVLLRAKFPFEREDVESLLEQITAGGHLTTGLPFPGALPHSDDEPFLEVAAGGEAEYLITGNLSHYPARKRQGVRVVSPSDFIDIFKKL